MTPELSATSSTDGEMPGFERFAVSSDVSDHSFLLDGQKKNSFTAGSKTYKKIMREWKLLQEGLPDSIFVRTYETRIDLLRAVIIGADGTPYHDGLFFFDIAFPSQYPAKPPKVQFLSYGLGINPNLYNSGFVCLSLLNTWYGSKKERWNPSESSILQVLLSIQALILNEKPFYNEPGAILNFGKRSQAYNEDVFILCGKMMKFLQRNPPRNFEAFVSDHFRKRAKTILSACEAYANGRVLIANYRDGETIFPVGTVRVSGGFTRSMEALHPSLVSSFLDCGASLGESYLRLRIMGRNRPWKEERKGILQKMMEKMKGFLGLKKK